MNFFKYPFYILIRIWFYVVMGFPLLLFFPVLLVLTIKESWYPSFFVVARKWAAFVLYFTGFFPVRKNGIFHEKGASFMFVANHVSMLDIFLMLHTVKNPFVFVGKKELVKIPVFGFFFKRTCIIVDRSSAKSRREVFEQAQQRISKGLSICIFPEGGVPEDESIILDEFKDGAFRLAIDHQLPIIPLVFPDNKKRFSYTFLSGNLGKVRSYILPKIVTEKLQQSDKKSLKENVRNKILEQLMLL